MDWLIISDDVEGYRPRFWSKKNGWGFLDEAQRFSGPQQVAEGLMTNVRLYHCRPIHIKDAERMDGLARMIANAQVIVDVRGGSAVVTEKPNWLPVEVVDWDNEVNGER